MGKRGRTAARTTPGKRSSRTSGSDLITRDQLAVRMDVHPRTIVKWESEGMPVAKHGGRGRATLYRFVDCRQWYRSREKRADDINNVDVTRERARKERAQAVLAEQTAAVRAKNLLPADQVVKAWSDEIAAVRTKLLAIPDAYRDRVCQAFQMEGPDGVERVMKEGIYDALRELADPGRFKTSAA